MIKFTALLPKITVENEKGIMFPVFSAIQPESLSHRSLNLKVKKLNYNAILDQKLPILFKKYFIFSHTGFERSYYWLLRQLHYNINCLQRLFDLYKAVLFMNTSSRKSLDWTTNLGKELSKHIVNAKLFRFSWAAISIAPWQQKLHFLLEGNFTLYSPTKEVGQAEVNRWHSVKVSPWSFVLRNINLNWTTVFKS